MTWSIFMQSLGLVLDPYVLLVIFCSALFGLFVGCIPGLTATMATALLSLVTGRKVRPRFAMTGELSLVGKVLPVGGIKEKVLAAKRAGIRTVLLPKLNEKDLKEVSRQHLDDLRILLASKIEEVFELALESR